MKKIIKFSIIFLAFLYIGIQLYTQGQVFPYHEDEHVFINRGVYFDLYRKQDFTNPQWRSWEAYDVPKFAELMYGLTLYLHGHHDIQSYLSQVKFNEGSDKEDGWNKYYSRRFYGKIYEPSAG